MRQKQNKEEWHEEKKGRKPLRRLQTNNELNKSPGDKVWKLTWRHKKASLSVQGNARIGSTKVIHSLASSGYCNRIHQSLDLNKPRSEYICISVSSCHPKSNKLLDISLSTPLYLPVRSFLMCKGCCVQLVQSEGPMVATSRAKQSRAEFNVHVLSRFGVRKYLAPQVFIWS